MNENLKKSFILYATGREIDFRKFLKGLSKPTIECISMTKIPQS